MFCDLCKISYNIPDPYTEYKIQVAAFTGGGRGKFSEKYPALTDIAGENLVTCLPSNTDHCQMSLAALF